ncbi:MAG: hypothetical protein AAB212_05860, partial [Bacteroidota bacterium]
MTSSCTISKRVFRIFLYLLFSSRGFVSCQTLHAQNPIPPIGQWREHLNYQHTIQVLKGDQLYCATHTNVFAVTPQNEIERYSRMTGLNDIGVQCIGWDALTEQLIVVYTNSNVDLLKNGNVKNIG